MLRWHHQWGNFIPAWERTIARGGEPHPKYYTQPMLEDPRLQTIYRSFNALSSERSIGMGQGPIPRSAIKRFVAEEMDYLHGDDADQMEDTLRAVDDGWLGLRSDKQEQKTADTPDPDQGREDHPISSLLKGLAKKRLSQRQAKR